MDVLAASPHTLAPLLWGPWLVPGRERRALPRV